MKITTIQNKRTLLFLFKKEGTFFASLVCEQLVNNRFIRTPLASKEISEEEYKGFLSKREELSLKSVFVIEVTSSFYGELILEVPKTKEVFDVLRNIVSPYFNFSSINWEFLTVQKTRGP